MANELDNKEMELPKSQQELFRSMMIKEKLRKIQEKLVDNNDEITLKKIKEYAEDSQLIKALKLLKDKK